MPSKRAASFQDWQKEIGIGLQYQDRLGRLNRWDTIRDFYLNRYPENVVSVNLIFAIGRSLVPQLYFKAPRMLIRPRPTTTTDRLQDRRNQSRTLQAVDEWLISHMGLKYQLKLMVLDSYRVNLGVGKIGYHTLGVEVPRDTRGDDRARAAEQLTLIADALGSEVADGFEDETEGEDLLDYSYHDYVKPDSPWVLRTPPEDLIVPWGTRDIWSAPWCAFRVVRPFDDVDRDPVYSNLKELKPNSGGGRQVERSRSGVVRPLAAGGGSTIEGEVKFLEFFEVWDKRTGRIMALTVDQGSGFMRNEKHNLGIHGLPVSILQFNPDGDDFWGASDAEQILTQVIEFNETRTQEQIHRRLANIKMVVDKNKMDKGEQRKMASPVPGPVVEVDGDPRTVVTIITPPVNRELFATSEVIRDDIREVVGFSRNQTGDFEVSRRTATEAAIVQQNIQLRSDERRDQVADLLSELFQAKIHPLIFKHWDTRRVIQVTGEEDWREFTGTEIAGDYDVTVVPDSTLPLGKEQAKAQATELFAALRGDPRVRQGRLYEWMLSHFEDVPTDELLIAEEELKREGGMETAEEFARNVTDIRQKRRRRA